MQELHRLPVIDLSAQVRDVYVDHVVERCRAPELVPHVARKHLAAHGLALMTREVREQIELAGAERDDSRAALHASQLNVEHEIAYPELHRVTVTRASEQHAQTSQQFRERKRLDQVVVGA